MPRPLAQSARKALHRLLAMLKAALPAGLRRGAGRLYRQLRYRQTPAAGAFLSALQDQPVDPALLVYACGQDGLLPGSPQAICAALLADPAHAGLRHVWLNADAADLPEPLRHHPALQTVAPGSPAHGRVMAQAGRIVTGCDLPAWFLRRDGQQVVCVGKARDLPMADLGGRARSALQASQLLMPDRQTAAALVGPADILQAVEDRICWIGPETAEMTDRALACLFAPPRAADTRPRPRPRLLIFCGGWKNNGITSSALNLLNSLARHEIDIHLLTEGPATAADPELQANLQRLDPAIHRLPRSGAMLNSPAEQRALERFYSRNGFADPAHEAEVLALFQREARRSFGDLDFDAVVDFSGYSRYWALLLSQVPARTRAIWQHNDLQSEAEARFPILKGVFATYRHYDQIVSVSDATQALNRANLAAYYANPAAAVTLRNVIRPDEIRMQAASPLPEGLHLPQARPLFAMAGRLSPEKAPGRVIRALGSLRQAGQEAGLVLMGSGPLEAELRAEASRAGVSDLVCFAGHIANPFPVIAQADCFVLSSDYEGQPMVLLEALTLGKPVIATDIAGARSVLSADNGPDLGLLVPVSDAGLEQGMRAFLDGQIGMAGFDAEAYCRAALEAFCLRVLGDVPPLRPAI